MPNPDFAGAIEYARLRLERELSPLLAYHNLAHTRDDVSPAAAQLARLHGVSPEETLLLLTAAWYHDLGYIERREDHEATSAQIAAGELPRFGYTSAQIDVIKQLILSTRMPTAPTNWFEGALTDADLNHLGTPHFMEHSHRLRRELAAFGSEFNDAAWLAHQLTFLQTHAYYTEEARRLWDAGKGSNIALLERMLERIEP